VSAIATPRRVEETRPRPSRTITDRLLAAVPLASVYLCRAVVLLLLPLLRSTELLAVFAVTLRIASSP